MSDCDSTVAVHNVDSAERQIWPGSVRPSGYPWCHVVQTRHGPRRKPEDRDACEPSAACCSRDRAVVRGPRVRTLLHRRPRSVSNPSLRWARSERHSGCRPPLHRQLPCGLAHRSGRSGLARPRRSPRVPSSRRTAQHQPRPSSLWFPLDLRFRQEKSFTSGQPPGPGPGGSTRSSRGGRTRALTPARPRPPPPTRPLAPNARSGRVRCDQRTRRRCSIPEIGRARVASGSD